MKSAARSKSSESAPGVQSDEIDRRNLTADDLRQQNVALAEENRKLKQLAEYRSAFLARLAHELRTPLTSILGFAEIMLNQEELTEAQRNFCERIQNSAQQLQGNFNQLADLSRLEGKQAELLLEEFSVDDLLRESCAAVARQAQKQHVGLRSDAAPGLPLIISDRSKLRQVLYNFLAYAINRSPDGGVVRATAEKALEGLLLKIEDEGESPAATVGLEELHATDRRFGDSELGLAIARKNIDLVGATMNWEGRQPRGLRIIIQLPAVAPDAHAAQS
jgi:signal transduction histidine kinase